MNRNLPSTAQTVNQNLVTITAGKPTTTSILIAETSGKRHSDVLRDFENLDCSAEFRQRNFALADYVDDQGKPRPMYRVTKDGFVFVVMGYRGPKAAAFKEKYITEFNRMERALSQRHDPEWLESRQQTKIVRRGLTDTIQDYIRYAEAHGSEHARHYYTNFTKMVNTALCLNADGPYPIRDLLNLQQQAALTLIESAVADIIRQGIAAGVYYKEIFQTAKGRVLQLAPILAPAARLLAA